MPKFALALAAALTLLGCAHAPAAPAAMACGPTVCGPHALRAAARTDRPATHGMLVVGSQTIYLSHLPMFHAPHDYQVIVKATFNAANATYLQDRAKTGTKLYTLVPEPFVLPDVIQHKKSFHATLFRGHFERGGVAIAEHVQVDLQQVLLFQPFDPAAHQPTDLQYFLFGHGADTFLAHLIVAPPDYDQVVQVQPDQAVPAAGEHVTVGAHGHDQFLKEGETASAQAPQGLRGLTVGTEVYHETGDLAD